MQHRIKWNTGRRTLTISCACGWSHSVQAKGRDPRGALAIAERTHLATVSHLGVYVGRRDLDVAALDKMPAAQARASEAQWRTQAAQAFAVPGRAYAGRRPVTAADIARFTPRGQS